MPTFRVDLSQSKEFKTPDEGTYLAVFKTVKQGTSKAGNPKIEVMLELTEAFDAGNDEFVGQNVFDHLNLDGKAAWKVGAMIEAVFGHRPEPDEEFDTDDLIDLPVIVEIVHDVYAEEDGGNGQITAKIAKYKMAEGGGII